MEASLASLDEGAGTVRPLTPSSTLHEHLSSHQTLSISRLDPGPGPWPSRAHSHQCCGIGTWKTLDQAKLPSLSASALPLCPVGPLGLFLQPLVFILHLVGKIEAPKLPIFPPESLGNSRLGAAGRPGAQIPGLHRARALPATSCLAPPAPLRALGEL